MKHKQLSQLKSGSKAKIISINGGRNFQRKMNCMGLREGKIIEIKSKQPLMGPLTIKYGNSNFTIGRGMAHKITVEEI
jgi:ferrous iron transport protein A